MKNIRDARREEFEVEEMEYDEEFEIIDECVEEITQELLDELEDLDEGQCFHCFVKDFLMRAYLVGREDGVKSLANSIANTMNDIIED
jgi:hypothetical protein